MHEHAPHPRLLAPACRVMKAWIAHLGIDWLRLCLVVCTALAGGALVWCGLSLYAMGDHRLGLSAAILGAIAVVALSQVGV